MSVRPSASVKVAQLYSAVAVSHLQNSTASALLSRRRRHLACIFCRPHKLLEPEPVPVHFEFRRMHRIQLTVALRFSKSYTAPVLRLKKIPTKNLTPGNSTSDKSVRPREMTKPDRDTYFVCKQDYCKTNRLISFKLGVMTGPIN